MIRRILASMNCRRLHLALAGGGIAIIAIAIATIVLAAISLDNYHRNVDSRRESRSVLIAAKDLDASLRDVEAATWRYVFTGDRWFFDWHESAAAATRTGFDKLAALAGGAGYQHQRLDELRPLVPLALEHLDAAITARDDGADTDTALAHLIGAGEREALDRAHLLLAELTADEDAHITALTASTDRRAKTMTYSVSALAVVNLALLVVLALYVRSRSHEALLQRSNEAKDQFIGLVSHELRNPISGIMNAASILERRGPELAPGDRGELLDHIREDAARLDRRIGNMLLVARLDDPESDLEPLLLQRLIPRVVELHLRRFPSRTVELRIDDALPAANGDASYVEQVLLNLLANAEKYGNAFAAIEIEAAAERECVRIAVLDRGDGIDVATAQHLFEPFFRTDGARRKASGAGLGLAVCRRLVEMQHGRIWAAPREGGGAVFAFTLTTVPPVEPDPAPALDAVLR